MVYHGYMIYQKIVNLVHIIVNLRVIKEKEQKNKGNILLTNKRIEKIKKNLMNYAEEEFKFR